MTVRRVRREICPIDGVSSGKFGHPRRHTTMRSAILTLGAAALILAGARAFAEDQGTDRQSAIRKLVGGYTIISGEEFGKPAPKDRIKGDKVRITNDKIVVVDKDSKEVYVATYKLDTAASPWKITMTSTQAPTVGEVAQGLIWKDGDKVKLIYALPGGAMPSAFKTKEKQLMFVMQSQMK
jgi:uncharacterized protein (TIGR03067 family)